MLLWVLLAVALTLAFMFSWRARFVIAYMFRKLLFYNGKNNRESSGNVYVRR